MPDLLVNSPDGGKLEVKYNPQAHDNAPIAVLMHPHPQHGGTMHNKVVFTMAKAFHACGFSTVRFNFRGVGHSTGQFSNGLDELVDAATALDWIENHNLASPSIWLAGFSFGSWIATQLMIRRPEVNYFISIGTPTSLYDFSYILPCPTSGLFLHAANDDIASTAHFKNFMHNFQCIQGIHVDTQIIDHADHFFTGVLDTLESIMISYISERLHADGIFGHKA